MIILLSIQRTNKMASFGEVAPSFWTNHEKHVSGRITIPNHPKPPKQIVEIHKPEISS
jgi:hypothetical protein